MKAFITAWLLLVLLSACSATDSDTTAAGNAAQTSIDIAVPNSPYQGAWLSQPYRLPALPVASSQAGRLFLPEVASRKGIALSLFTVGYTSCADGVCDLVVANAVAALNKLPQDLRRRVQLVMISGDPQRDSRTALASYMSKFAPVTEPELARRVFAVRPDTDAAASQIATSLAITLENPAASKTAAGITTPTQIGTAAAGVQPIAWSAHGNNPANPHDYEVVHGSQLVGVNPAGDGVLVWTQSSQTVTGLAADLTIYLQAH